MYDFFHLPRFLRLMKKTLLERPFQFFGFTGAMLAILFIYYSIYHLPANQWYEIQKMTILLGLTGGGTVLASFVFGYFTVNATGISYLTLPASHFEKWLCAVLITLVLYPLLFLVFFKCMDTAFVDSFHRHLDPGRKDYQEIYQRVQRYSLTDPYAKKNYVYFVNYAGAMMLGSLYFDKLGLIKSGLLIGGVFLSVYLLNLCIAKMIIGGVTNAFPFDGVDVLVSGKGWATTRELRVPPAAMQWLDIFSEGILPVFLWATAYVRLTEKQF